MYKLQQEREQQQNGKDKMSFDDGDEYDAENINKESNLELEEDDGSDPDFDDDDEYDAEEVEKKNIDQEQKLQLLTQHLESYCNDESEYDDFRKFGKAIRDGKKLTGTVLSGGYTNYSYKIHLEKNDDDEDDDYKEKELAVFAKIAFPYALWSPDTSVHYDLTRVTAEFELMKRFSEELKTTKTSPIPEPYVLIDIPATGDGTSPNMRIFVAEWVTADEQWGNQYIEGEIDERVVDECARTVARINLADCDKETNQGYCDSMKDIAAGFDDLFVNVIDKDDDKAVIYARDVLGRDKMLEIIKSWHIASNEKECLVHGDCHVFNMLVERKPDPFQLSSSYGPNGDFLLCDWEMAHCGHKGRDVGTFFTFPVMSACYLAARGHKDKCDTILNSLKQFWNTYKTVLVDGLKSKQQASSGCDGENLMDIDRYLADVFRSGIAFYGFFSFIGFYLLGCMTEYNETEGLNDREDKFVMGVVGWTGLRSMQVGLLDDAAKEVFRDGLHNLPKMEEFFFGMISNEIDQLLATRSHRRRSRRRSSILRESGCLVSDSESGFGKIVRRLSQQPIIDE